jgi:hypothetical protein
MKKLASALSVLLLAGCVSAYRNYNYDVYPVSDDLTYVRVFFWGEQFVPGWKEKAQEAARRMIEHEVARHQLVGKISIVPEPLTSEMGGIAVDAFVGDGRAYTPEEAREIKRRIHFDAPHPMGKAKLPNNKQ